MSFCNVLTDKAFNHGNCMGRNNGLNERVPSPEKCHGWLIISPQSLPPYPPGHTQRNIAHPSLQTPPFLQGLDVQNERFSGHPGEVPLSVTNLQAKMTRSLLKLKPKRTYLNRRTYNRLQSQRCTLRSVDSSSGNWRTTTVNLQVVVVL